MTKIQQQPQLIIRTKAVGELPRLVRKAGHQCVVITDSHLRSKANELSLEIKKAGLPCSLLTVPAGEKSKSLVVVEELCEALVKTGLGRDGVLVALGGGVIGDLAGFVASVYMRGIPFISVPTTVIAMADSSLGGKTGVDLASGKNLVGTFYPPMAILMHPTLLETLPDREFKAGCAEIIKHGVIHDERFFTFLEKNRESILARKPALILKMLKQSAKVKLTIVGEDPREALPARPNSTNRSRMLLNYGHTIGHALEKLSEYTLPHGEAVAIGMIEENRIAVKKGILTKDAATRISTLIENFGLPTKLPKEATMARMKKLIARDKKKVGSSIYFALPTGIGSADLFPYDLA